MNYQPGYHPYIEPPTRAEADADAALDTAQRPDPDTQLCIAAWVTHDRSGWLRCPACNPQISTNTSQNGTTA